MRRSIQTALTAFGITVVFALSAAAAVLLPDHAADATDLGIVQLRDLFATGAFER